MIILQTKITEGPPGEMQVRSTVFGLSQATPAEQRELQRLQKLLHAYGEEVLQREGNGTVFERTRDLPDVWKNHETPQA